MGCELLVTGFEPFAGDSINPSEDGVRWLANVPRIASRVRIMVLPVTYVGAPLLLLERIRVERPAAVLAFGLSRRAQALTVESVAENLCDSEAPDNAGVVRRGVPVVRGGPERVSVGTIVDRLAAALGDRGLVTRSSTDAGRFVCNATLYAALHRGDRPVAFVHIPATTPIGGEVAPETLRGWMRAAVESMLELLPPPEVSE